MKKIITMLICCLVLGACSDNHGAKTKAGKTFVKFANAKTIEQKAKYILEPEEMLPYMRDFYKNKNIILQDYQIVEETEGGNRVGLKIKLANRFYWAIIKKENDGSCKVDWQYFTSYTPNTIGEYVDNYESNELLTIFAVGDRSVSNFIQQISPEYYAFRMISAGIGQGVLDEKEEYEVHEQIVGLCPKTNKECKEFNALLSKKGKISGCYAIFKIQAASKYFKNPWVVFAQIREIVPHWTCQ